MKPKLKAWFVRLGRALPGLKKQTLSVAKGTLGVLAPCALLLLAMYMLNTLCQVKAWPDGAKTLLRLLESVAVTPVTAGMITYAAGASWESRGASLIDAVHLARIRIKEIVLTGVVAGLTVLAADWIASMIYSLIGLIPALLGWIPLVGPVITAIASSVIWLLSLAMEFIAHAALVMGMLSLTADGLSGRPQIERVLNILRSGHENLLQALVLIFGLWIVAHGVYELAFWALPVGSALICDALVAAATALSMTAISVVYLKERDRMDGMRFHV